MDTRGIVAGRLRKQARACVVLGSPLYALLLDRAAEDAESGGFVAELMAPLAGTPTGTAIALRLMGSVHRLVLEGRAPELAEHYPSVGGTPDRDKVWPAFIKTLDDRRDEIGSLLQRTVQTNEVARSAALLGGFLEAARSGLPLRVLEIGASGGLNVRWDHFRYEHAGAGWGDLASPVRLSPFEVSPDLSLRAQVVERAGCDPDPVDPTTEEGRLTLRSYVWPDQPARWAALQGALEIAARVPAPVEKAMASNWLEERLSQPRSGVATVVLQSIVDQYMTPTERERVSELLGEAGKRASVDAPLAWLRMEPPAKHDDELAHVHLTMWPDGDRHLIARAGYHGSPVVWLGA